MPRPRQVRRFLDRPGQAGTRDTACRGGLSAPARRRPVRRAPGYRCRCPKGPWPLWRPLRRRRRRCRVPGRTRRCPAPSATPGAAWPISLEQQTREGVLNQQQYVRSLLDADRAGTWDGNVNAVDWRPPFPVDLVRSSATRLSAGNGPSRWNARRSRRTVSARPRANTMTSSRRRRACGDRKFSGSSSSSTLPCRAVRSARSTMDAASFAEAHFRGP